MPWTTSIDRLFNQKVLFYTFVGIIVGTTAVTLLSDSPIGKRTLASHNSEEGAYIHNILANQYRSREIVYK
jgi:hypothetical protein